MNAASAATIRVGQDYGPHAAASAPLVPFQAVPSAAPIITHSLTLRGVSTDDIHQAMADSLRAEGWELTTPAEVAAREARTEADALRRKAGESPKHFMARLQIAHSTLARAWHNPACPEIRVERGKGGINIVRLWPTPEFEAWILRHKPSLTRHVQN